MGVTHPFHSDVADGDDDSLVQPSDWNADHVVDLDATDIPFTPTGTIAATTVQDAIAEVGSEDAAAHLTDTADAHDASAISILDTANDFTATDVEGALAELQSDHEADATALTDHTGDTSGAHAASAISADSTTLVGTGTTVQAVFEELDNAIVATETVANNAATKNGGGKETYDAHGGTAVGAAETIDLANGNVHRLILDENVTITLSGTTAAVACSVTVILVQDGTGTNTVTWPASVQWAGGTPPTITAAANAVDVVTLLTVDNGTTWYGFVAGQAMD